MEHLVLYNISERTLNKISITNLPKVSTLTAAMFLHGI